MRVEIVDDEPRFRAMAGEWRELLEASAADCLFLTWEWLHTWWRHLGRGRLRILTLREGGELAAVLPLAMRSHPWLPSMPLVEFLGRGAVGSDYLDAIVRPGCEDAATEAFAAALARTPGVARWTRLPDGGTSVAGCVVAALTAREWRVRPLPGDVCPAIDLAGHDWDSLLATMSANHRYNVRRKLRHLRAAHDVRFEAVEREADRAAALGTLIDLHQRRWRARGGSTAFGDKALYAFHEAFSQIALARGWLRLYVLRLDGTPAAALYGFAYRQRFYFYQSGFDPARAHDSVGLATMALSVGRALDEGLSAFDLLHGAESYKFHWAHRVRRLVAFEVSPPGLAGAWCRAAGSAYRAAARTARLALGLGQSGLPPDHGTRIPETLPASR